MPYEPWPTVTIDGKEFWKVDSVALMEKDPQGQTLFFVGTPLGGIGNVGPLVQGDPGLAPVLQEDAEVSELEHDDPTPASSQWVVVSPGNPNTNTPPTYKEVKTVRKGAPGDDGDTVLAPGDFTGVVAGRVIAVNGAADGFELVSQKVGGMYWPASVTEAPAGTTTAATVGTITVPSNAIPFDWFPLVSGVSVRTGSSSDVLTDLVARLNGTGGPVVGRCPGLAGAVDRLVLPFGPDSGASTASVKVAANAAATIYFRVEKQSGGGTFSTGASPSRFGMIPVPVP